MRHDGRRKVRHVLSRTKTTKLKLFVFKYVDQTGMAAMLTVNRRESEESITCWR